MVTQMVKLLKTTKYEETHMFIAVHGNKLEFRDIYNYSNLFDKQ
jgi:hypothetical protein